MSFSFRSRMWTIAIVVALGLGGGCATNDAAKPKKGKTTQLAKKQSRAPEPFFWRVKAKDERPGVVYLLGTMHLVRPENRGLDVEVVKVRDRAHTLALELDPEAENAIEMRVLIGLKGMLPDGESLAERFTPEEWKLAVKIADDVSLPVVALERMRPWLASLTLAVLSMKKMGYDDSEGVERQLLVGRSSRKQKVVSLESADLQISALASLDDDVQVEQMKKTLLELDKGGEGMHEIEKSFVAGDAEALVALLTSSEERKDPAMDRYYKVLLDDRNVGMQKKITRFFSEPGETLVAVGAAHLVGKKGLVQAFQDAGYEVLRIPGGGKQKKSAKTPAPSVAELPSDAKSTTERKDTLIQGVDAAVVFPAPPKLEAFEQKLPDGTILETKVHVLNWRGVEYAALEVGMPKKLLLERGEKILASQKEELSKKLRQRKATEVQSRSIEHDGFAGIEVQGKEFDGGGLVKMRFFITPNSMVGYTVSSKKALSSKKAEAETERQARTEHRKRFFESIRLQAGKRNATPGAT